MEYEEFLEFLGTEYQTSLVPDSNDICQLQVNTTLSVQLKLMNSQNEVLISTRLGDIGAGKGRELALEEGLRENSIFPKVGTFCYIPKTNEIALFTSIKLLKLTPDAAIGKTVEFIDYAYEWHTAIKAGKSRP